LKNLVTEVAEAAMYSRPIQASKKLDEMSVYLSQETLQKCQGVS